jgi:hypothetical protein
MKNELHTFVEKEEEEEEPPASSSPPSASPSESPAVIGSPFPWLAIAPLASTSARFRSAQMGLYLLLLVNLPCQRLLQPPRSLLG